MKLALIRRRFTQSGGAENYTSKLAEGLGGAGIEVHLVCESWKTVPNPSALYSVRPLGPVRSPWAFANAVEDFLDHERFDFVFSLERIHRCDLYRAGDGVHRRWLEIKNRGRPLAAFFDHLNPKHRQILALEEKLLARGHARHIIANSQAGAREITQFYGRNPSEISIIYNGVENHCFEHGDASAIDPELVLPPRAKIVLLVGSGWRRKGIAPAIEAIRLLRQSHEVTLLVLGRNQGSNGEPSIVQFARPTAHPQHFYAAAHVFLLPSLYEPFSNACLEALAAGLPVVTSRANGVSEILTPNTGAAIEDPTDPAQIANALRPFLDSEKLAATREPARCLARQYPLEANLRETIRTIVSLVPQP